METGEAEQCRAHLPKPSRRRVTLNGYPGEIRQLAIADLGHEEPTLLLTNQEPVAPLRYARRIENAEAIEFMDALSAAVPMKIDVDLQLTLALSTDRLPYVSATDTKKRRPPPCSATSSALPRKSKSPTLSG